MWIPEYNDTSFIVNSNILYKIVNTNSLLEDHADPLVNELRHLWNTREQRFQKIHQSFSSLHSLKLTSTFYNVFTTPIHQNESLIGHDTYFEYEIPNLKHVHVKGSRKSIYKEDLEPELSGKRIKPPKLPKHPKIKIKRDPKKKLQKIIKNNIAGRPKQHGNKSTLQKLIQEWNKQEKYSSAMKMKYLQKPFPLKKFKPDYKYGKVQWKTNIKYLELHLKIRRT